MIASCKHCTTKFNTYQSKHQLYCSKKCFYEDRTGRREIVGWSRKYPCCIDCKTTEKPYHAYGRCLICFNQLSKVKDAKRNWELKNKDKIKEYRKSENFRVLRRKVNKKYREEHPDAQEKSYLKNKNVYLAQYKLYRKTPVGRLSHQNSSHKRRLQIQKIKSDIDTPFLVDLWSKTKICELCQIEMEEHGQYPNGKQLDHILPLYKGGLHLRSNVRYICARCNYTHR